MVAPVISASNTFFWNLSANVGVGSSNNPDDVELVQLGYLCMSSETRFDAALRAVYARVVPGAPYSGAESDPLTIAIRAHEKDRGGTQDGHVSVVRNLSSLRYDDRHSWMLIPLNNQIRRVLVGQFPRLDKHPRCPARLRGIVAKVFD